MTTPTTTATMGTFTVAMAAMLNNGSVQLRRTMATVVPHARARAAAMCEDNSVAALRSGGDNNEGITIVWCGGVACAQWL